MQSHKVNLTYFNFIKDGLCWYVYTKHFLALFCYPRIYIHYAVHSSARGYSSHYLCASLSGSGSASSDIVPLEKTGAQQFLYGLATGMWRRVFIWKLMLRWADKIILSK